MTTPTILCPIDFSDCSRRALNYAGALADHFGARLIVLNVTDPILAGAVATYESYLIGDEATREVITFAGPVVPPSNFKKEGVDVVLTVGDSAAEILRVADDKKVDLLVMGTQGLGGFRKWFFGSTTERVLRRTDVPVLAVPVPDELAAHPNTPLLDTGPVLAPVDFSAPSDKAARIAAAIALSLERNLLLLHAVAPIRPFPGVPKDVFPITDTRVDEAFKQLNTLAASMASEVRREIVVPIGRPDEEIVDAARKHHAAVIVMALQAGKSPFGHGPGSVAYRVLSQAAIPVLAIPLTERPERPHLQNMLRQPTVSYP